MILQYILWSTRRVILYYARLERIRITVSSLTANTHIRLDLLFATDSDRLFLHRLPISYCKYTSRRSLPVHLVHARTQ